MSSVQRGLSQVPSYKRYVVSSAGSGTIYASDGTTPVTTSLTAGTVLQDMGKTIITVNTSTNVSTILRKVQVLPRSGAGSGRTGYIRLGDANVNETQAQNISVLN